MIRKRTKIKITFELLLSVIKSLHHGNGQIMDMHQIPFSKQDKTNLNVIKLYIIYINKFCNTFQARVANIRRQYIWFCWTTDIFHILWEDSNYFLMVKDIYLNGIDDISGSSDFRIESKIALLSSKCNRCRDDARRLHQNTFNFMNTGRTGHFTYL